MAKRFLLVDSDVLPDVFMKVVKAKELLASGSVKNLSAAAKEVNISRSALYKYKDKIFYKKLFRFFFELKKISKNNCRQVEVAIQPLYNIIYLSKHIRN